MAQNPLIKRYLDAGMAFTQLTQAKAEAIVRDLVNAGEVQASGIEDLVNELEEPVRALKPGIERVGRVLDDPVVDTVPDTLRRIQEDLVPLIHGLRVAQSRVGSVTGLLRRLCYTLCSWIASLHPAQRAGGSLHDRRAIEP